jgi:hypothetical protein
MTITYQWEIMNLHLTQESGSLNNIVNAISWVYRGINENHIEGFVSGKKDLTSPNIENFISYNELTRDIIISWLEINIDVNTLKPIIENQIENNTHYSEYQLPLPWTSVVS